MHINYIFYFSLFQLNKEIKLEFFFVVVVQTWKHGGGYHIMKSLQNQNTKKAQRFY